VLVYDCWEWEPAGGQRQGRAEQSSSRAKQQQQQVAGARETE